MREEFRRFCDVADGKVSVGVYRGDVVDLANRQWIAVQGQWYGIITDTGVTGPTGGEDN